MGDRVVWAVYFLLCIISLVEVFSAASTLSYRSGSFWDPLIKQALFLTGGTIIVLFVHKIPCRLFKAIPILLYPLAFILLLVTSITGDVTNGARRWYDFFGIPFQPSELGKGAVVIAVALILSRMQTEAGASKYAIRNILYCTLPICGLIFTENLSTACLLFGVVVLMMFIGRVSLIQIGKLLGVIVLLGMMGISLIIGIGSNSELSEVPGLHRLGTWSSRIESHFGEDNEAVKNDPSLFDIDADAQVAHANIAIASSGIVGKMPGNSVERDFLSQAFSDFIYAIIIEELGLIGAAFVAFLYIVLLFRAGRIASRCERSFPPLLAMGLTLLIVSQAVLNMMVAVGLFPVTGQPLPLISRGGTSTLINCIYIGMILSVSRYARQVSQPQHTQFDGSMEHIRHEEDKGATDYIPQAN